MGYRAKQRILKWGILKGWEAPEKMFSILNHQVLGAGVAAVPKEPGTVAKSYDLHLTSSYKPQTSWELRRCTRIPVNRVWWRYAPAALISWSCVPGEAAWPAVRGWEYKRSERPRVRGRYKQGRYKQEETGLNKRVQKDPVAASFFLASWARART